ncbi:MAG: glycine--tRNA ligase subunit alpha [Candidatus Makana argininalis]
MKKYNTKTFQGLILSLQNFWINHGCILIQPIDIEVGAGTSHPITYLRAIGPEPISAIYVQSTRRPCDGRYGKNPNRLNHYYQLQVIIKPSLNNIKNIYLESLLNVGLDLNINDLRFVEDNWENPTLGSWGIGWEILLNDIEITQFTYFQQVGGFECVPVLVEITYGLERLAMNIQNVDSIYKLIWSYGYERVITYGDLFYQNEIEISKYNFEYSNIHFLLDNFKKYKKESKKLIKNNKPLIIPAYEFALKAINNFNLLDARNIFTVNERKRYILEIRNLTKYIAKSYFLLRKSLHFPMLNNQYYNLK